MDAQSLSSLCDDFYVDMFVNTELELPTERETLFTYFERIQRQYPSMSYFYRRDQQDFCLEEDRHTGSYRWVCLEKDRIGSGVVNPESFQSAYEQDALVLELIPYMLSVSHLDVDSLDLVMSMDFNCPVSHDEVIAEALFGHSAFGMIVEATGAKPVGFSPSIILTLSEDLHTQARISVDSKTSVAEMSGRKNLAEEAITVSMAVRHFPRPTGRFEVLTLFKEQCRWAEELMAERIVPTIVQPLTEVIAQRRGT